MKNKLLAAVIISCSLVTFFPIGATADIGPKDQLTVYVENPPTEDYYLDLLTQHSSPYDNYQDGERESLDQEMIALLYSYKSEGWTPALVEGTGVPMWGSLTGKEDGNRMVHKFGYVGVPDTYRIIIVTKGGKISVSETYTRKALQSSITFDYRTGRAEVPSILLLYSLQFAWTFALTLLVEGVLLYLFGFSLKENLRVFFLTNLLTQLALTLTVGATLIRSGTFAAHLFQFPAEIIILVFEVLVYKKFLAGQSAKCKIAYGIVANLLSWLGGFLLLNRLYLFLVRLY